MKNVCNFLEAGGYCTFWSDLSRSLIECRFPKKEYYCAYNKEYDTKESKETKKEDS